VLQAELVEQVRLDILVVLVELVLVVQAV